MNEAEDNKITEFFRMRLAGRDIEVEVLHRDVFRMCREYLAEFAVPDFVVSVSEADIAEERTRSAEVDISEGRAPASYSDGYLETLAVYRKIADNLLRYDTLLFHGAAIAAGDRCFLFMAKSGTGKSTHIRKWLKLHPETFVVNGDKPLIHIPDRMVYGTPWCGKEGLGTNTAVPLGGFIRLERGETNGMERISFSEMLPCLMNQCHIPPRSTVQAMRLLGRLRDVPCWCLRCNMDDEAGEVSYRALVGLNKQ